MSTPSENPSPNPISPFGGVPASSAPASSVPVAPKPAFKVTRSPFAPKISGTATAPAGPAAPNAPLSIGASGTLADAAPRPMARKTVTARRGSSGSSGAPVGAPLLVLDLICAAVAVAAAVMLAHGLGYF